MSDGLSRRVEERRRMHYNVLDIYVLRTTITHPVVHLRREGSFSNCFLEGHPWTLNAFNMRAH